MYWMCVVRENYIAGTYVLACIDEKVKNKYKIVFSASFGLTTQSFTAEYIERSLLKYFPRCYLCGQPAHPLDKVLEVCYYDGAPSI